MNYLAEILESSLHLLSILLLAIGASLLFEGVRSSLARGSQATDCDRDDRSLLDLNAGDLAGSSNVRSDWHGASNHEQSRADDDGGPVMAPAHSGGHSMTSQKTHLVPANTAAKGTLSLEQLIDAHRPLLFCRMPRMLRGDGTIAGSLQHELRFFRALHPDRVPVSARRWKAALLRSRILRAHRRRADRAH